jgi:hypothetical protein
MKLTKTFVVCMLAAAATSPALARNTAHFMSWDEVMQMPEAASRLGGDLKFTFGDKSMPADAERIGADEVAHNISQGAQRNDDALACKRAALEALAQLASRARQVGANAVVNVVSYYKKNTFSSATQYECHAGGTGGHISIKADLAKLSK